MTNVAGRCPACREQGLEIFHEQGDVPVHSCRLVDTRAEAEAFPRGSLRLGVCPACGFVANTSYDPSLQSYFVAYEETQGFSPRFREFMLDLATRWIDRYDLRGKDVLEIGCGKGEFLLLMCELGAGHGVGIDPAIVFERVAGPAADRVEFIRDLYSEAYAHLEADAIVCRHTLEHIQPVADFVGVIRTVVGPRTDTTVLFELPDVMRVLTEGAFWDVYYEHCSYFTAGSLARLFRRAGFEVLAVELDYDDQYILLEARPTEPDRSPAPTGVEEPADEVVSAAGAFGRTVDAARARWRGEVADVTARGGRTAIWGSGSKGVAFLTTLGLSDEVGCVVDINPYKHGKFMAGTGHEIVPPGALQQYRPDLVIAMNPIYTDEIRRDLDDMGLENVRLVAV